MQHGMLTLQRQVRDMSLFLCHVEVGDCMMGAYTLRPTVRLSEIAVAVQQIVGGAFVGLVSGPTIALHRQQICREISRTAGRRHDFRG